MSGVWSSSSALPLSGGKRRSRHSRRHSKKGGDETLPGASAPANTLKAAGAEASSVSGAPMEGGRRRKMTAKKVVKKLAVLARQAKKLTLRLKKMKKHH